MSADHRPVRQRELDADRRRQAPADAAAAQAEEALRIVAADELPDAGADDSASSITTASFGSISPIACEQRQRLHRRASPRARAPSPSSASRSAAIASLAASSRSRARAARAARSCARAARR